MPHRYFTTDITGTTARLHGQDAHHLARVMRAKLGEEVILCDGNAVEYTATITGFEKDSVTFSVSPGYPSVAEPTVKATLFVGYPKQGKLETIVQKAVELGASEIVPVEMSRSIVRLGDKADKKRARWQAIAHEAAGQSGRGVLPLVAAPVSMEEAVSRLQGENAVVCYEGGGQPFRELIPPDTGALSLVIGPEGGIAPEEIALLCGAGAKKATLGRRILRCETAPVAAIAAAMALTGNME